MTDVRILVSDKLSEAGLATLREAGFAVDYRPGLSENELAASIGPYDALVIRSGSKVTGRVLERADALRVIGRAGIGVDNVDVAAASRRGIVVMNTPLGNVVTTAEHTLALLLAAARRIPQATASMRAGKWEKNRFEGRELCGKTLGIVGLGNVGRAVAERARALHMKVIATDPNVGPERAAEVGAERVELDELLARADFITLHVAGAASTRGLIDARAFARMKRGVVLVNASRGGVVDEQALLDALEQGIVEAAALDVFETEPPPADHPLLRHERVVLTPHLGASTVEAQERVAVEICEQVVAFLRDGTVRNAVNVPALGPEASRIAASYGPLARRLGALLAQLDPSEARELRVECAGETAEATAALAAEALAGYLSRRLGEEINALRAPFEARARNLPLVESREPRAVGWVGTVRVTLSGARHLHTVTGTRSPSGEPRLVGLDGYHIDALLRGQALLLENRDRPGVIGAVGTILGRRGINVSRMQVGLDESTRQAVSLWNVDSTVPQDALAEIGGLPDVSSARLVDLG
ncbi:MAG: phosphoglycerate dehydrogenase [Myxococcota bacterium]|nr:phosphoglycerate dehydrogenase [Myxococcota bacterium]MDW8362544.1 phosphoglycerate dehydrogenase [Myxococcales bacterium]